MRKGQRTGGTTIETVRKRAERVLVCAVFVCLLSVLAGCGRVTSHPTDILKESLDAELTVSTGDIVYRVTVHLGAVTEGCVRDAEVIFLSPESLSGITARKSATGCSLTRGEMTVRLADSEESGLLLSASLLSPAETVSTDTLTENGMLYTVFLLSDGRTVYADAETGEIKRIRMGECIAEVEWIGAR